MCVCVLIIRHIGEKWQWMIVGFTAHHNSQHANTYIIHGRSMRNIPHVVICSIMLVGGQWDGMAHTYILQFFYAELIIFSKPICNRSYFSVLIVLLQFDRALFHMHSKLWTDQWLAIVPSYCPSPHPDEGYSVDHTFTLPKVSTSALASSPSEIIRHRSVDIESEQRSDPLNTVSQYRLDRG
jgi:hypothetical protein